MKQAAKINLKKNNNAVILVSLVLLVPGFVIDLIDRLISYEHIRGIAEDFYYNASINPDEFIEDLFDKGQYAALSDAISVLSFLITLLFVPVITAGLYRIILLMRGNINVTEREAFAAYKNGTASNVILVSFLTRLITGLYTLLFIIPGIVVSFSYSMVPLILAVNPSVDSKRARDLSRNMMYGHKLELFVLDLSFLGWFILSLMTLNVLGVIFVYPYYRATIAEFYSVRRREAIEKGLTSPEELPAYGNDWYAPFSGVGQFGGYQNNGFGGFAQNNGYAPPQQGYDYTPPQQNNGYTPPQQGYGYAPPQQNNGYTPPVPPQQGYPQQPPADSIYPQNDNDSNNGF